MRAAVLVESRKAAGSVVVRSASVLLVVGIVAMSAVMSWAAAGGNEQMLAKLGPLAEKHGWDQLIGMVAMISAPATLLGFGVVLSWIVGREFADGTIAGLFALPVSRGQIALAKLVVFFAWAVAVACLLVASTAALGVILGYGVPAGADLNALLRLLAVVVLTGLLAVPAGWAASLGRGLLPGIATTIVLIVLGQVLVVAGTGAWFPVAAPGMWAAMPSEVSWTQLVLVPLTAIAFVAATAQSWDRLQLDR